ncbi:MAG: phosphotransferase, partial [Planctomycetales bacterium]
MQEDVRDRPRFSSEEAIEIARSRFGVAGSAEELPSERDQNFRLRKPSGDLFVLKLANAAANRESLECQNQAMRRVAEHCGESVCPRPVPAQSGNEIIELQADDGRRYFGRLLTHVPGVPLAEVNPHSPMLLDSLGRLLGSVSEALRGFSHPAAVRDFVWDLKNSGDVVRDRGPTALSADRWEIVAQFLKHHEEHVVPKLDGLRVGVLHNDANDYNVLVEQRPTIDRKAVALLDFGDMVESHLVNELAICLGYAMLDKPDPLVAAARVVQGYHAVFPLTE